MKVNEKERFYVTRTRRRTKKKLFVECFFFIRCRTRKLERRRRIAQDVVQTKRKEDEEKTEKIIIAIVFMERVEDAKMSNLQRVLTKFKHFAAATEVALEKRIPFRKHKMVLSNFYLSFFYHAFLFFAFSRT